MGEKETSKGVAQMIGEDAAESLGLSQEEYGNIVDDCIYDTDCSDKELEDEIRMVAGDYEQVDVAWNKDFDFIARHFAEWQKERDDEFYAKIAAEQMNEFIQEYESEKKRVGIISEEPMSDDFDKEVNNYFFSKICGDSNVVMKVDDLANIARHFAEWQKNKESKLREENNICCMKFDDIEDARLAAYEEGKMDMKQQMLKNAV